MKTQKDLQHRINEIHYLLEEMGMNIVSVNLRYNTNSAPSEESQEEMESYKKRFDEFHEKSRKDWEKKVTEAAGYEYEESKPFDRDKMYEVLGDKMYEIPRLENDEFIIYPEDEEESLLTDIKSLRKIFDDLLNRRKEYIKIFTDEEKNTFTYFLYVMEQFVERAENYSNCMRSLELGKITVEEIKSFRNHCDLVSLSRDELYEAIDILQSEEKEEQLVGKFNYLLNYQFRIAQPSE